MISVAARASGVFSFPPFHDVAADRDCLRQEQDCLHLLGPQRHPDSGTFPFLVRASHSNLLAQWSMIYASTRENLKNALNIHTSIHADDKSDIEWKMVLAEASGGKAGK